MNSKVASVESLVFAQKKIAGTFVPPPDKSITHRAIFLAALSCKESIIKNPLLSEDCISTIKCFRKLGVPIKILKGFLKISAGEKSDWSNLRKLHKPLQSLDCGNSGTTMRLLSGVLAAQPFTSRLSGDHSLSQRPMHRVIEPLVKMGAKIQARKNNFSPLVIQGNPRLKPIFFRTPVASAQVKSAILLAGLFADGKTAVQEPIFSRDHTERMLKSLGVRIQFHQPTVSVWGGGRLDGLKITVTGDFSSAAFFIAAALLVPGSHLIIKDVNLNPTRTGFLKVLKKMGGKIKIRNLKNICNEPVGELQVQYSSLRGISVGKEQIPLMIDEIPILAVLATQAEGRTVISGAEELRVKESDRLAAIASELKKMGAKIQEKKDGLIIEGLTRLRGVKVNSYDDHRIAMSLAIAGLIAEGKTSIKDFDSVQISFPKYFFELKRLIKKR